MKQIDDINAKLVDRDAQVKSLEQRLIESQNHQLKAHVNDSTDFESFATDSNVS